MTKRIFRAISLVALVVFAVSLVYIMGALYEYFSQVQQKQLRTETELAAQGVEQNGMDYFEGLDTSGYRITWIGEDGTVLYDSRIDAENTENHLDRKEIALAMENGYGESIRFSETLGQRLLYSAKELSDGSVIRLSGEQKSIFTLLFGMFQPICVVILLALILSLVLASGVSKRVVKPLNELNLDHPLSNEGYDELSPLLRRIDSQQKQLRWQAQALEQKQKEFETVTDSMNEGLILLNGRGMILSINRMAAQLLGADKQCIGKDILTIDRSLTLQELLQKAQAGSRAEKLTRRDGGTYQLDVSPIFSEGEVCGAVLLIFDVTEREQAEQMRREFTANVSHELKTPLHTISGCAELLCNDLVKPQDVKQFTGQIYTEAQRMIHLVEDIINLSHLDEGAEGMTREKVDLYPLAEAACKSLAQEAEAAGVTLELHEAHGEVMGNRQLLSGIVYNLCDNAIKYNVKGGSVSIGIAREEGEVVLRVQDTGIGIPQEQQKRIFERFYRVDKSHSKEMGGTGLGLSIVKHAAQVHGAKIDLKSTVGAGTTISVRFPREEA